MLSKIALLAAAILSVTAASANEFELSRIAGELSVASKTLASELKYSRGFGSVGQRADRLARDSQQLVNAIARRHSPSYIRSQFADVSGRYSDLEDAFFRASRNYSNDQVFNRVGKISTLFGDLSTVYYYSPIYTSRAPVVTFVNPAFVQRQVFLPNWFPEDYSRGNHGPGNNVRAGGQSHPNSQQLDQRRDSQRGTVVERLRAVEGRHRSSQRIIRQRGEGH
jgi:hypothetical protein